MHSPFTRIAVWYDKIAAFNVESLFARRKEPAPPRSVFVKQPLPNDYYDKKGRVKKEHVYASNQVITSKYTVVTFLPRNLLEQFRRIANCFFLAIAILQFFSIFSTVSKGLVILPLLIVLGITAIKDGYEDIKRHQSDRSINSSTVRVLSGQGWQNPNATQGKSKTFVRGIVPVPRFTRKSGHYKSGAGVAAAQAEMMQHGAPPEGITSARGQDQYDGIEYDDGEEVEGTEGTHRLSLHHAPHTTRPHWKLTKWEDVHVGDIVKIMDNESIPADILICATSEEDNVAFIETKNLDGETNLKSRTAAPALTQLRSAQASAEMPGMPGGFRVDCDRPDTNLYKMNAAVVVDGEKTPVDIQNVLLRGTVLRNTGWVIGTVLYTGQDTKIVMNSGNTPSKRSKVERQMNPQVLINLLILAAMAVVLGIVDSQLEQHYFSLDAPWLYGETRSDDNPHINGLITWAFALITFQNIVPISLYISIEFVRTIQALFIYFDREIYYDKTDQATLARSWNLSDDLGQIEYIFSDKTGTLTQNAMVFRKCSVGGVVYHGDPVPPDEDTHKHKSLKAARSSSSSSSSSGSTASAEELKLAKTFSGTASGPESASGSRPHSDDLGTTTAHTQTQTHVASRASSTAGMVLAPGVAHHFRDAALEADIARLASASAPPPPPGSEEAAQRERQWMFWTTLALCHTVLTSVHPEDNAMEYKAQSPDEAALVQAAADVGFVFRGREKSVMSLTTPFGGGAAERWELLNVLEFNSTRKRMSVIVRRMDGEGEDGGRKGEVLLLSKGADNVIFERLRAGGEEMKKETEGHLAEFANEGLRTLTLAYRVVPGDEYEDWNRRYSEATVALEDREGKIDAACEEIERDLVLLGATAIEDRLQDGVPETIADLKEAGIKIWVATGDKLETAIAIGHSTNLIGREDNIIIIRGTGENGRSVLSQLVSAIEQFFPDSGILDEEPGVSPQAQASGLYPLQPVNTGVSDIVGRDNGARPGGFVLVIDGGALGHALSDEKQKHLLLRLATKCEGVICCRVSPLQKALIVKLVKDGLRAMTLAIGDGANDVSMIQAADVGVGISGEEGLQAVNSSDYAIAQFRFLKRLLLVHGHWSYARNGNMIVNFFYKNIVCIGILWWFQIYCAWSSQYVFEYTYLLFWNSFWTIAPVIAMGLFDRNIDDHILMARPELYRLSQRGDYFNLSLFGKYMIDGVYQSAVIFFLILYAYVTTTSRTDGYAVYIYEFSTTMAIATVMAVTLFNGLNTSAWTGWVFFALGIEIVLIWAYTAIYSVISPGWFTTPVYGNDHYLFRSAYFWLGMLLVIPLALLPRFIAKAYKFTFMPDEIDKLRWLQKVNRNYDFCRPRQPCSLSPLKRNGTPARQGTPLRQSFMRSRTDMSTGVRSAHHGFDFAMEENGVALRRLQSNLSERKQPASPESRRKRSGSVLRSLTLGRSLRKKPPMGSQQEYPEK